MVPEALEPANPTEGERRWQERSEPAASDTRRSGFVQDPLGQEVFPGPVTHRSFGSQIRASAERAGSLSRNPDRHHEPMLAASP